MNTEQILNSLLESDPERLAVLFRQADDLRKTTVGDAVHLRGLIEISNHCARQCAYCGLRAGNREIERYRMTAAEILESARLADFLGYGTVVLQSGEDYEITGPWLAEVIRQIKAETPLAVTLSLGERNPEYLKQWREAGADRYLLRFETSDAELFARIHPAGNRTYMNRPSLLMLLRDLGYQIGSGIMVGIPGQSYRSLAEDIDLFRRMDLDMIGVGPFIPHPNTPLGQGKLQGNLPASEQVPNTEAMVYKVMALTRLVCPDANIPSTTALATINTESGREQGLCRGANVVMPNLTPKRYRRHYEIYPNKACFRETPADCSSCLHTRIQSIGRSIGEGPGDRVRLTA